jgi:hypothetical protein
VGLKPIRGRVLSIVLLGTPGGVLEEFVDFGVECVVEVGDQVMEPFTTQFAVVLTPSCEVRPAER